MRVLAYIIIVCLFPLWSIYIAAMYGDKIDEFVGNVQVYLIIHPEAVIAVLVISLIVFPVWWIRKELRYESYIQTEPKGREERN